MKSLKLHLLALLCVLATLCSTAAAQINLPFGQVMTGQLITIGSTEAYTVTGNVGDVIDLTMTTTLGLLIPKIQVYNPGAQLIASNYSGSPISCVGNSLELNTLQLPVSGKYTVLVSDCSLLNIGSYSLFAQRTNNPVGALTLPLGTPTTGSIASIPDSATYTFSANAGDEFDFTLLGTSGSLIPKIRIYNPNGSLNSSNFSGSPVGCLGTSLELNTVQIPTTGTYTVLVGDCLDVDTGNFEIDAQKTDSPAGFPNLPFGQTLIGVIGSEAQSNTYTFTANANDVVDLTMVKTSGNLIPRIRLYNPDGSLNISNFSGSPVGCGGVSLDLTTVALPTTGSYTVLISDCNDINLGNYSLFAQRTNNPGGTVVSLPFGQAQTGLIGSVAAASSYTFTGNAHDRIDFALVTTNGSLIPKIRLYNTTGLLNSVIYSGSPVGCSGGSVELNTVTLPATGTYTVLVSDCNDSNTGNFAIYAQRTNNPAGATIFNWGGQTQSGIVGAIAQSTTYTFQANAGASILNLNLLGTTTGGTLVPKIRLYNPDGTLNILSFSGSPVGCSGIDLGLTAIALPQTGTYTLLVSDCNDKNIGDFNISGQCTGCVTSPTITWPAPAPIVYGTPLSIAQLGATASVAGNFAYSYVCPTLSGTASIGSILPVGLCSLSVTFTPLNILDFLSVTVSVPLTVTQATPPITWPTPAAITYGTALSGVQLNASSTVPGAFVYLPLPGTLLTPPTDTLSVTFTPTDLLDYKITTATVSLAVNPATPTCVWPTPAPITTIEPLTAVQLDASCTANVGGVTVPVVGTYVYAPALGTLLTAGTHTLSFTFTPTNLTTPGLFNSVTGSVSITVNLPTGTPVISWAPLVPITYGTPLSALQLDATAALAGSPIAGVFSYSYVCPTKSGVATIGTVLPAGVCTLSASFLPKLTSYTTPALFSLSLTVNMATPLITWPNSAAILTTTPLSKAQLDASASWTIAGVKVAVAGNFAYSFSCPPSASGPATIGTLLPAGACTLTVTFTATDTIDFNLGSGSCPITVNLPLAAEPVFTPPAGIYPAAQLVSISDVTPGATIYYTTNGSTPSPGATGTTEFTVPILVNVDETIKAIAVATGYSNSPVAAAVYRFDWSPSVLAEPATEISTPTATLNALVNLNGLAGTYYFQYGTNSTALTTATTSTALAKSAAIEPLSSPINGLVSGTTYYYQVVVTTPAGTTSGAVLSFTAN